MTKLFGRNDKWFLGILALLCVGGCSLFYVAGGRNGAVAEVTVAGEFFATCPLEKDLILEIKNEDGITTNTLQIKDGKADMIKAQCPDHLCVHQKAISKEKETIVCLPNQVVVEIKGTEESEFDSMT